MCCRRALYPPCWANSARVARCQASGEITIRGVKVPSFPKVGETVTLEADYDLGGLPLESVKWIHDNDEFYTVTPKGATTKYCPGIQVDVKNSNAKKVVLQKVIEKTGGMFKCEIWAGGRMQMKGAGMKVQTS